MRRGWLVLIGLGAFACRDDARHAPSLVGGLDGGPVAALDGGLEHQPDGARGDAGRGPLTPATACAPVAQVLPVTAPAYHRTGKIDYPDPPPVGGDHNPCWGKWGVYDASSPLAVEHWVHNLEHGGVVYLYNCADGCADEVAQMASFVDGRTQAILTPYAALPTRFAVVAWGVRITSDCFDKTSFERFYSEHVNHGSEQISSDPPSSCL